jgi:parallel beta-helix repeat protein
MVPRLVPRALGVLVPLVILFGAPVPVRGATYYVRQGAGSDTNDGRTPASAWRGVARLGGVMRAGDTAYVGPGLYRDGILLQHSGASDARITLIADPAGTHTGDAPGPVVVAGTEPVDEGIFTAASSAGVYRAAFADYPVLGVVEMDGRQRRYLKAEGTAEHTKDGLSALEVVAARPGSYHYDAEARQLYLHTSDGKPPHAHEIELIRRQSGVYVHDQHYVTVAGFTFRHMGDAGINFFRGAREGVAMHNTSYGSHQGISVYGAYNVLVYGNTLFGNENCGVYFAAGATGGLAIGNIAYENAKGARWSSGSNDGMALGNALFDNHERGLAIESTERIVVRDNRLARNAMSQLMVMKGTYDADQNCFENRGAEQVIADFIYGGERYADLAGYRRAKGQDSGSRTGDCGPLPEKIDVLRLQRQVTAYGTSGREGAGSEAAGAR